MCPDVVVVVVVVPFARVLRRDSSVSSPQYSV